MSGKIIFISIDGMTDPLGQSQVMPYLAGLSAKGFNITIISCEKPANFMENKALVTAFLNEHKIDWKYCFYQNKIPLISQRKNLARLKILAEKDVVSKGKDVVLHCRSYIPALIGLKLKRKYHVKFIFDMRGFWADERVEGNIWKLSNPIHRFTYKYFKRKEKQMLEEADYIVTLSDKAKQIINNWFPGKKLNIQVIPCCVDTTHFKIKSPEEKKLTQKTIGIPENTFVVGYLGSIGTWYMLDEMLDFFVELKKKKNNALFFFVTPDNSRLIIPSVKKKNISPSSLIIRSAKRHEVPDYISAFDLGLFFIRPSFSKKGSSPTKLAELLACGVPLITNTGVGDCDSIINTNSCGFIINNFTSAEYEKVLNREDNFVNKPAQHYRDVALANFSLEEGVLLYNKIYSTLVGSPH